MSELLDTVSAIITKDNKILFQDHIKCNGFTLPGGKVDNSDDNSIINSLIRELYEELDIVVLPEDCSELLVKTFHNSEYPVGSGKYISYRAHIFNVSNYSGEIKNKEPDKHKSIRWLDIDELKNLNKTDISNTLIDFFKV